MKICLIMHGQPRFLENQLTWQSHKREILDKYDTDVVCHTWFSKGKFLETSSWSGIPTTEINDNSIELIKEYYNPLFLSYDEPRHFFLDQHLEKTLLHQFKRYKHWNKKNISNSLSSLCSIEKAIDIAMKLDLNNYDFIILSRYDNLIYKIPDLNLLQKDKFYISDHHDKFPDLFFIFSPKFTMAFKAFSKAEKLIKKNINLIYPESSLNESLKMLNFYSHFSQSEIIYTPFPVRVVRSESGRGDTSQLYKYNLKIKDLYLSIFSIRDFKFFISFIFHKSIFTSLIIKLTKNLRKILPRL